jgi:hypothetical protein
MTERKEHMLLACPEQTGDLADGSTLEHMLWRTSALFATQTGLKSVWCLANAEEEMII